MFLGTPVTWNDGTILSNWKDRWCVHLFWYSPRVWSVF